VGRVPAERVHQVVEGRARRVLLQEERVVLRVAQVRLQVEQVLLQVAQVHPQVERVLGRVAQVRLQAAEQSQQWFLSTSSLDN
jgi:hypothetical protein